MIGSSLLKKNGRSIKITDSGEVLLGYARRLLEMNDETIDAATNISLSGAVRIGISQDFAEGWLTTVLARFSRAHVSTVIEVLADRNAVLMEALDRKAIDFALTFGYEGQPNAIDLGEVPLVWIGAADKSWIKGEEIPLVAFDLPCEFRRIAVDAIEKNGKKWRLSFTSPSLSSQWSALEAGLGVTLRTPIGKVCLICPIKDLEYYY